MRFAQGVPAPANRLAARLQPLTKNSPTLVGPGRICLRSPPTAGALIQCVNIMENIESGGLLPRFTLKWFSICFTLSILIAWILRQAVMESLWAQAMIATLLSIATLFAISAILFLTIWIPSALANLGTRYEQRSAATPPNEDLEVRS